MALINCEKKNYCIPNIVDIGQRVLLRHFGSFSERGTNKKLRVQTQKFDKKIKKLTY